MMISIWVIRLVYTLFFCDEAIPANFVITYCLWEGERLPLVEQEDSDEFCEGGMEVNGVDVGVDGVGTGGEDGGGGGGGGGGVALYELVSTTSKALPGTVFRTFRSLSFQRAFASPVINQFDPLSATIIPYFLSVLRITRDCQVNLEIS